MQDEDILRAAREIMTNLPDLLGPEADRMSSQLRALLIEAETDRDAVESVFDLLAMEPATREELARRLPQEDTLRTAYPGGLPGWASISEAISYSCTVCDYVYPVFEEGESVPRCPRGHGALVRTE